MSPYREDAGEGILPPAPIPPGLMAPAKPFDPEAVRRSMEERAVQSAPETAAMKAGREYVEAIRELEGAREALKRVEKVASQARSAETAAVNRVNAAWKALGAVAPAGTDGAKS